VEDSPGHLRPVSVTPVPLDELRRVWDHPLVWDREKVYYAPAHLCHPSSAHRLALLAAPDAAPVLPAAEPMNPAREVFRWTSAVLGERCGGGGKGSLKDSEETRPD
jgi:hypothetical protein